LGENESDEDRTVALGDLKLISDLQPRAALDPEAVEDYAALYGVLPCPLPPVLVFEVIEPSEACGLCVIDGWHRVEAARRAGRQRICYEIADSGTLDDARWIAARANARHGVRRTNADKRRAIEMALKSEQNEDQSNRAIARHVGVSYELVRRVRAELIEGNGAPDAPPGADNSVSDQPDADTATARRDGSAPAGGFYQSAAKKLRRVHGAVCDLVGETDDLAVALGDVVTLANQYATAELDAP
jgi:transposase-like protein